MKRKVEGLEEKKLVLRFLKTNLIRLRCVICMTSFNNLPTKNNATSKRSKIRTSIILFDKSMHILLLYHNYLKHLLKFQ